MITQINSVFAKYGIPNSVTLDNGPWFSATAFNPMGLTITQAAQGIHKLTEKWKGELEQLRHF